MKRHFCLVFLMITFTLSGLTAQPHFFWPDGRYDPAVPTPGQAIGVEPGERMIRHHEVIDYFRTLAEVSPRAGFFEAGRTHEGRLLSYLVISSENNMARLDTIRARLAELADPRSGKKPDFATPAVAWMMYSIHGDEVSGTDAAVQLAYQLTAGIDSTTLGILDQVVVGIDPMENPDGRERYLGQMQQWNGLVPNPDVQDITHRGIWPYGRGNHYLFDLIRDWFILANPESRARMKALNEWHPQVVVDAHEMGSLDTYLFNPPREPINVNIRPRVRAWWETFSQDQARAFDAHGWSYYTREWYDNHYPGYSEIVNFWGAVALLYEQAGTDGSLVKLPSGRYSTFRDAVHRQFISSMTNLTTAATHREGLLRDFHAIRAEASRLDGAFLIDPSDNPSRAGRLVERLGMAGIEVYQLTSPRTVRDVRTSGGIVRKSLDMPTGAYIVPLAQPLGFLARAILEFDPRMRESVLQKEYSELMKGNGTHLYEVTAWSMLLAYDVEAVFAPNQTLGQARPVGAIPARSGALHNPDGATAFLCPYADDRAVAALLAMFDHGLEVRTARKPFSVSERDYDRGTLLLRAVDNDEGLSTVLNRIAEDTGVDIFGVPGMRSSSGPDLGGNDFPLLEAPRMALLSGPGLSPYSVGTIRYLLDYELKTRVSILDHTRFSRFDLRKYNVIILPDAWHDRSAYQDIFDDAGMARLKDWVNDGGTLVAIKEAAALLADTSLGFSEVRLRRQALTHLPDFEAALAEERRIYEPVDSAAVWNGTATVRSDGRERPKTDMTALTAADERGRRFHPRGAILRTMLDSEHWLTYGAGPNLPALVASPYVFMSRRPVETAARFARADSLRLSGLLWPEARERWAETAWLTREAHGRGQVILFADEPNFRSYFYGTTRLFLNALLLGPGLGTEVGVAW